MQQLTLGKLDFFVVRSISTQFIKNLFTILLSLLLLIGCATVSYKDAISGWKSHEDVGKWLDKNFIYDSDRSRMMGKRLKKQGPSGLLVKKPEKLYKHSYGYCADAANFAIKSINAIDSNYNARWVFVFNSLGRPHHWVAAFTYQDKLYIMDYGAGPRWRSMNGVHGPYDTLEEYREYLKSLVIPAFRVGKVYFRDMPGTED